MYYLVAYPTNKVHYTYTTHRGWVHTAQRVESMTTETQSIDRNMSLLRAGSLSPNEVILAGEFLKDLVRRHRRRTHQWCWSMLGITKRQFYRFLAVGRWSKKVKNLINANKEPLSQTALFKLADRKKSSSKVLFQDLCRIIQHLKERKRNKLKVKEKAIDFLREWKAQKQGPKYLIKGHLHGKSVSYTSRDLEASKKRLKLIDGLIVEKVFILEEFEEG